MKPVKIVSNQVHEEFPALTFLDDAQFAVRGHNVKSLYTGISMLKFESFQFNRFDNRDYEGTLELSQYFDSYMESDLLLQDICDEVICEKMEQCEAFREQVLSTGGRVIMFDCDGWELGNDGNEIGVAMMKARADYGGVDMAEITVSPTEESLPTEVMEEAPIIEEVPTVKEDDGASEQLNKEVFQEVLEMERVEEPAVQEPVEEVLSEIVEETDEERLKRINNELLRQSVASTHAEYHPVKELHNKMKAEIKAFAGTPCPQSAAYVLARIKELLKDTKYANMKDQKLLFDEDIVTQLSIEFDTVYTLSQFRVMALGNTRRK